MSKTRKKVDKFVFRVGTRIIIDRKSQKGYHTMTAKESSIHRISACELTELYATKALSPVEVTKEALARIDTFNNIVNAYCLIDRDSALAAAKDSEARWARGKPNGLADGVPVSVKDIVLTKEHIVRRGSLTTSKNTPEILRHRTNHCEYPNLFSSLPKNYFFHQYFCH